MKCLSILAILLCFCCTPEVYIKVREPKYPVPQNTTAFTSRIPIDEMMAVLKENAISYSKTETGYITEVFHIDEGTVGRFNFYESGRTTRVVPFWGITDKVRNDIAFATGMGPMQYSSSELYRVSYDILKTRPKMVFDYAVQLFSPMGELNYISVE